MYLVNPEVSSLLTSLPYSAGHGAGAGLLYYTLARMAEARVCVCLGSGGGFVPCLMRQAQRDMGLRASQTYLVDAILPEAGYGGPDIPGGWRDDEGVFARYYPEIVTLNCLTQDAGKGFFRKNRIRIDFLHVDADHSFQAAMDDFETYLPLLNPFAFVTFHDTNTEAIQQVLKRIARTNPEFDCLDMPDFGAGLAVLRRNARRYH